MIPGFMVGSDGCGVDLVVFRVCSYEADENDAGIVVDFHDQTIGVALDVEDDAVVREDISGRIVLLNLVGAVPASVGGFFEP
jgi:hypothetical protein